MIGHKTVVLDPWLAKMLSEQLTSAVKSYEKQFGKIERTKAQQKAASAAAKAEAATTSHVDKPSYMG